MNEKYSEDYSTMIQILFPIYKIFYAEKSKLYLIVIYKYLTRLFHLRKSRQQIYLLDFR